MANPTLPAKLNRGSAVGSSAVLGVRVLTLKNLTGHFLIFFKSKYAGNKIANQPTAQKQNNGSVTG
jgi:hypothetical protein